MAYTTINKSTDYFNTKLYTGNGSTNAITGVGFQPDWLWLKDRSAGGGHILVDAVRGNNKSLSSQDGNAEVTRTDIVTAFNSDGFTLGADSGNFVNVSGNNGVGWNWKANGQGSANTDGSINTTYTSANTTAGFSISLFTGTGSNETVGHGLGVAPEWVIVKGVNNTGSWTSYHKSLGATKYMHLSETDAQATASSVWNSTAPTNQVFSVGAGVQSGSGNTYVAYCFAPKRGFSAMGSYTGNGSSSSPPFIYTGFKPAFVMLKVSSTTDSWNMYDNRRNGYNGTGARLRADVSNAEDTGTAYQTCDFYSNGFAPQGNDTTSNGSGNTYIFMAFAEAPLVGSNNVPCTAR